MHPDMGMFRFVFAGVVIVVLALTAPLFTPDIGTPSYPTIHTATISQTFGHLDHVGIDFNIPTGTEVYADLNGIVIETVNSYGVYGRYLMIRHPNGYVTLYGHLSEIKVSKGDFVDSGDLVALSGGNPNDNIDGDGWSSGAHLHWEIRPKGHTETNKHNVDPMKYLLSILDCNYRSAYVTSEDGLNVRLSKEKNAPVLYSLYYKDIIEVVEDNGAWMRLCALRPEYVQSRWVRYIVQDRWDKE